MHFYSGTLNKMYSTNLGQLQEGCEYYFIFLVLYFDGCLICFTFLLLSFIPISMEPRERSSVHRAVPSSIHSFHKINSSRKVIVLINRLRSQHVTSPTYLHKIYISETPYCNCSQEQYTADVNYIIFHCKNIS